MRDVVRTPLAVAKPFGAEAGIALISCTVILCAVLIMAMASQQQVRQAHLLATNLMDRNMALQAAEAALLDAEAAIRASPEAALLAMHSDLTQHRTDGTLTDQQLPAFRTPHYQIAVVFMGPAGSDYFYRITAKGFGQRESAQVVLQADFRWSSGWRGRIAWRELSGG